MIKESFFRFLLGGSIFGGSGFLWLQRASTHLYSESILDKSVLDISTKDFKDEFNTNTLPTVIATANCKDKITLVIPKELYEGNSDVSLKLSDVSNGGSNGGSNTKDSQKTFTTTFMKLNTSSSSWANYLRRHLDGNEGLLNYQKIIKSACEKSEIKLKFGKIKKSYKFFWWMGINYEYGFYVDDENYKNLFYGAVKGDWQTTDRTATDIEQALPKNTSS